MKATDSLRLDLDKLLAEIEATAELDYLTGPTALIDRMFAERKAGNKHPAFGDMIAFRPSELTVWAGIGGSGKSQLVGQVMAWLLAKGEQVTIASLEMPVEDTCRRMLTQILDAPPTVGAARAWAQAMEGRLWLYDQIDKVPAPRMIALTQLAATRLRSTHVVIDSLTKCGLAQDGNGYLTAQTDFVDSLQRTVKHLGVHCHLIVHLRKGEGGTRRTMHDIRGASQISDLADNVLILDRQTDKERILQEAAYVPEHEWSEKFRKMVKLCAKRPDAILQIEKQRATGWLGDVRLDYHARSGQFVPQGRIDAMPWKLEKPEATQ